MYRFKVNIIQFKAPLVETQNKLVKSHERSLRCEKDLLYSSVFLMCLYNKKKMSYVLFFEFVFLCVCVPVSPWCKHAGYGSGV